MYLIDGEDLYEVDESDCEFEGNGFWLLASDDESEEEFYELCEADEAEYDFEYEDA